MSFKHLAILSLGSAVAACAPGDAVDETALFDKLMASNADEISLSLGEPRAVSETPSGGQILAWVDSETAAALVVEVDASGNVIDLSFTPTWLNTPAGDDLLDADLAARGCGFVCDYDH